MIKPKQIEQDRITPLPVPAYSSFFYGSIYGDLNRSLRYDSRFSCLLRSMFQYNRLVTALLHELRQNQRVLQMGAVFGREIDEVAMRVGAYGQIDVIDINSLQVSRNREKYGDIYPGLQFICADAATYKSEEKYDCVIDIQGLMRSALVARLSGAESWGYSKDTIREPLASRFYTHTLPVAESLRPVRRYRTMVSRVLGYDIDPENPRYGLKVKPTPPAGVFGPYAALAVNTSRAEKLWPQSRWIDVVRELRKEGLQSVLFWGNDDERRRVEEIACGVEDAVIMPRSSLKALAQTIAGACCLAGVDTGLTHLGAALGVPSVGIIVGTSAELFSLVSEKACATVGDKGVVPDAVEVLGALHAVMNSQWSSEQ